ncbi:TPA: sugar phosphate isomerase/epimerase [Candidatus Poribacteria bacterium]|jgi:sugar phosphate isomerase/epimerase|nr:sugar phosphate isomerase/epimerase [Candidatus Poribacteria bacterium]HIA66980.1 sugar phosphate isomerase/epimerase [Candidatus Poribacteria bacterium]HIB90960.1 sugar phosphate isomerase/epimerase [Candidatus Poribacteria bacterium]HIB99623.1 sugar phosphate isomerase/epimerase [Candidatus Poribacteria bacterium]HIC17266.1 sugar phosphate isomerase/epimerase [Candidatus Poribacteria bacterium]
MACINAVSFYENRSIEDICHLIQGIGFESIEVSRIPFFEKLTTTGTRKVFADWVKGLGLSMYGFDAWVDFDPYHAREETVGGFKQAIDFASDLDLVQIIAHDGQIDIADGRSPGECLQILIPLFQEIADLSGQNGLKVVLEPHPDTLSMDDTFAIDLIDGIDRCNIGLVYDCCHYGVGQPDTYLQAIKNLAHRIQHIHFSDGDSRTYALHLPLGEGELALDAIVENLQEISFNGTLTSDMYNYPLLEDGAKRNLERIKMVEEKLGL